MMTRVPSNTQHGFTLIELLAVAMILSVLAFISITLFNSAKARDQLRETEQRLDLITAKVKHYYHTHGRLPEPAGDNSNEVPVQAGALDMAQKYRLDAWGRYLVYTPNLLDVGRIAASIESGGSDQNINTKKDNCDRSIDVTAEAILITQHKLKLLQEKVAAYDTLFAGVDNDGNGIVDDSMDVGDAVLLTNITGLFEDDTCPPTNGFDNDPSDGLSTLSAIEEQTGVYNCPGPAPVVDRLVAFYGLPEGTQRDPWDREFKWGYENRLLDDSITAITPSDRRYHRFFSSGPNDTVIEDDITFGGE